MKLPATSPRVLESATVIENREVARDTHVLRLTSSWSGRLIPGQFAMVHPLRRGCLLPRPFSLLDAGEGWMEILVKRAGRGSEAVLESRAGEELRLFAPLGRGFDGPELFERPAILVAGGVGVVPLHLLARRIEAAGGHPLPIFGARENVDLPRPLFEGQATRWQLFVENGPEADCREGRVTVGLLEALEQHPDAVVATCGPTPMMKAVGRMATEQNRSVWVCLEEQMGCGAGVCRACVVPHAHEERMCTVCKEGPVFRVDEIQYLEESA